MLCRFFDGACQVIATASMQLLIIKKEAGTANDISSDTLDSMKKESTFSY